jgi:hypothetical protein
VYRVASLYKELSMAVRGLIWRVWRVGKSLQHSNVSCGLRRHMQTVIPWSDSFAIRNLCSDVGGSGSN